MVKTTTNRHPNFDEKPQNARGQDATSGQSLWATEHQWCSGKQLEQECPLSENNVELKGKNPEVTEHYFPFKIEAIFGFNEQKPTSCDLGESDNNRRPQADLCFARLLGKHDRKKSEFAFQKNTDRDKILILNRTAPYLPGKWVVFGCDGGLWLERISAISTDTITFASAPNVEVPTDQVEMIGVVAKVQYAGFN